MSPPPDCNSRQGMFLHASGGGRGAAATTAWIGSEEPFFCAGLRSRSIRLPEEGGEGSDLHQPRKSRSGTKSSRPDKSDRHLRRKVGTCPDRGAVAPGSLRPRPMVFGASGSAWKFAGNQTVGNGVLAGILHIDTNTVQECREMQPINRAERYHLMNMPRRIVDCLIVGKRAWCGEVLLVAQFGGDAAAHRRGLSQGQAHLQPRTV